MKKPLLYKMADMARKSELIIGPQQLRVPIITSKGYDWADNILIKVPKGVCLGSYPLYTKEAYEEVVYKIKTKCVSKIKTYQLKHDRALQRIKELELKLADRDEEIEEHKKDIAGIIDSNVIKYQQCQVSYERKIEELQSNVKAIAKERNELRDQVVKFIDEYEAMEQSYDAKLKKQSTEIFDLKHNIKRLTYKLNLLENPPSKNRIVYNFVIETKVGSIDVTHIGNRLDKYTDPNTEQAKTDIVLVEDDGSESVVCTINDDRVTLINQEPVNLDDE